MRIFDSFFKNRIKNFKEGVENIETERRQNERDKLVEFYNWHYINRCAFLEVCIVTDADTFIELTVPGINGRAIISTRNLNTFGKDDWVFANPARIITCDGEVISSEAEARQYLKEVREQ